MPLNDRHERAKHFSKEQLVRRTDPSGASYWCVGLDHAMLTLFEVEPGARFERHSHESEQITHVLSGALMFEVDEGDIVVRAGEVIAIPANVPHAVAALDEPTIAVDAWSPIRGDYACPDPVEPA